MITAALSQLEAAMRDAVNKRNLLSPRQQMFVRMTAEGKSAKQIAVAAHLSIKTVETHRAAVMKKWGAKSPIEMIRTAIMLQLAELETEVAA